MVKQSNTSGFTLLELIVVLAGLSILTSLAIPNIARIFDFNNIDEAKALLNTAAADCLQKSRLDSPNKEKIDSNILSDKKLSSIGYKIDPGANNCSYLQLAPTNNGDELRFPIGFAITNSQVTKIAKPNTSDQGSLNSCENWAGANCKQDEKLKELVAYNKQIENAKTTCENNYSKWMTSNGSGPVNRWNPSADSACASRPPKVVSSTCTTNGCNRRCYALDGVIVSCTKDAEDDYKEALKDKYGRICSEKVESLKRQSPPFTNKDGNPVTFKECGTQEFWFHKGTQVTSSIEWEGLMCTDEVNKNINEVKVTKLDHCGNKNHYFCGGKDQLSQDNWDTCVANNAEAKCLADREKARKNNYKGEYTGVAGPGRCGETVWMCNQKILTSNATYQSSACGGPTCTARNPSLCNLMGGQGYYCEKTCN